MSERKEGKRSGWAKLRLKYAITSLFGYLQRKYGIDPVLGSWLVSLLCYGVDTLSDEEAEEILSEVRKYICRKQAYRRSGASERP